MHAWKEEPGYRPLTATLRDKKEAEWMAKFPVKIKMQLKSTEIPSMLDWMGQRKIEYRWMSWEGFIYFYINDPKHAIMMKMTWAAR